MRLEVVAQLTSRGFVFGWSWRVIRWGTVIAQGMEDTQLSATRRGEAVLAALQMKLVLD